MKHDPIVYQFDMLIGMTLLGGFMGYLVTSDALIQVVSILGLVLSLALVILAWSSLNVEPHGEEPHDA